MLAGKHWQITWCKVEPCSKTGEHRTCHLVPAGPHWICYGLLTWGGSRLCWDCTWESGAGRPGSESPFPPSALSKFEWVWVGLHHVRASRLRTCASWWQGKGERERRFLGVDNKDNHPCGKGSIWDIILFCLTGAGSISLWICSTVCLGIHLQLSSPDAFPLCPLAVPLALLLLCCGKSGCWQPAI